MIAFLKKMPNSSSPLKINVWESLLRRADAEPLLVKSVKRI